MQYIEHFIRNAPSPLLVLAGCIATFLIYAAFFGLIYLLELLGLSFLISFWTTPIDELLVEWQSKQNRKLRTKPYLKFQPNHSYNKRLKRELLILVRGDMSTIRRLIALQKRRNPGRSHTWYLEKVLYDLERDRR